MHFAKFSKKSFIDENKLTSRMMIRFIFMIALMNWHLSSCFFFTKKYELRYDLWQNFRISLSIRFWRILMTTSLSAFEIENVDDCHVLCDIVLIFYEGATSSLTCLIFENFQIITVFLLNNIFVKTFLFFKISSSLTMIFFNRSLINRDSQEMFKNLKIKNSL